MSSARLIVAATAVLILLLTLLTGPVIGIVEIPAEGAFGGAALGEGSATIEEATFHGTPTLSSGDFGADQYVLRVDDVVVSAKNVTGNPFLVYKLEIEELGYTRSTLTTLKPGMSGKISLELSRDTIERSKIDQESYAGQLRLVLRQTGPDRIIAEKNVTVAVQG